MTTPIDAAPTNMPFVVNGDLVPQDFSLPADLMDDLDLLNAKITVNNLAGYTAEQHVPITEHDRPIVEGSRLDSQGLARVAINRYANGTLVFDLTSTGSYLFGRPITPNQQYFGDRDNNDGGYRAFKAIVSVGRTVLLGAKEGQEEHQPLSGVSAEEVIDFGRAVIFGANKHKNKNRPQKT